MLNPDENLNKLLYPHDMTFGNEERLKRRAEREQHSE